MLYRHTITVVTNEPQGPAIAEANELLLSKLDGKYVDNYLHINEKIVQHEEPKDGADIG